MIYYTPAQIQTILYSIEDTDGMLVLAEYLKEYGQFYPRYIWGWIEDIRLFMVRIR